MQREATTKCLPKSKCQNDLILAYYQNIFNAEKFSSQCQMDSINLFCRTYATNSTNRFNNLAYNPELRCQVSSASTRTDDEAAGALSATLRKFLLSRLRVESRRRRRNPRLKFVFQSPVVF